MDIITSLKLDLFRLDSKLNGIGLQDKSKLATMITLYNEGLSYSEISRNDKVKLSTRRIDQILSKCYIKLSQMCELSKAHKEDELFCMTLNCRPTLKKFLDKRTQLYSKKKRKESKISYICGSDHKYVD